jgi:hypothetical protein
MKVIHEYNGTLFDSREEIWFAKWCEELEKAGYLKGWVKETKSRLITKGLIIEYVKETQLKTKLKKELKKIAILKPSEYTPDFEIRWSKKGYVIFVTSLDEKFNKDKYFRTQHPIDDEVPMCVEIKPDFDQKNMERLFVNNQKFLWETKKIYVNLIHPIHLFKDTFLPDKCREEFIYKKTTVTKRGIKTPGMWKVEWKPKTLAEYIKSQI